MNVIKPSTPARFDGVKEQGFDDTPQHSMCANLVSVVYDRSGHADLGNDSDGQRPELRIVGAIARPRVRVWLVYVIMHMNHA
jgi:hypothetical protein